MTEERRQQRLAQSKAYHAKHRDAILARQRARRKAKRDSDIAHRREWRKTHPEQARANDKRFREAIPPQERQRRTRIYNAKYAETRRAWYQRNKERLKEYASEWTRANRGRVRAKCVRRLARKRHATPQWADQAAIQAFYDEAARLTKETGIKHEVDHIVPLKNPLVCGLHIATNLRVVTQAENRRKNNRLITA